MNKNYLSLLILMTLLCNFTIAQKGTGYAFITEEDKALLQNEFGELSFSRKGLHIDQFLIYQNHIFITSVDDPGVVKIYDSNQLLVQKLKFKNKDKDSFIGLYKSHGNLFYNPRPNGSKYFKISLNQWKWTKKKINLSLAKDKKIYFGKTISTVHTELGYYDTYGIVHGNSSIESFVTLKKNTIKTIDTLLTLPKNNTTILQPYSSWTYDIVYNEANENYFVQDFRNGIIYLFDRMGQEISKTNLSELIESETKVIYSYFSGNYKFHSKIIIDQSNMETYLYFGIRLKNTTQGKLFKWNDNMTLWQRVKLSLPDAKQPFPFVNIYEINNREIYFPLNILGKKEGIYSKRIEY